MKVKIKPLSVNECWKGRRFKTDEYKIYEWAVYCKLKKMVIPKGKLKLIVTFGFSTVSSDCDNPLKPLLDILQKKYKFNDSRIYKIEATKDVVPKGKEYIDFDIEVYDG